MSRFYFHVRIQGRLLRDPEGIELSDLETAHSEASAVGEELVAEACAQGESLEPQQFEIADASGETRLIVPLGHAFRRDKLRIGSAVLSGGHRRKRIVSRDVV